MSDLPGQRAFIPPWLADSEAVAPCYCGQPLRMGQPYGVVEGENGLKRWVHAWCWHEEDDEIDDD